MKIVHAGNFNDNAWGSAFYAVDNKISNGLIRNGHYVYNFSYRDIATNASLLKRKKRGADKMGQHLMQVLENIAPDFLLLGHTELISNTQIELIRQTYPNLTIAMWFVDDLDIRGNRDFIASRADLVDAIFCTTGGSALSAVGTDRTKLFYLPNPVDESIETFRNDEKDDLPYDLVFCGRDYPNSAGSPTRSQQLPEIATLLAGFQFEYRGCMGQPFIRGNDYLELLSNSTCCLNLSRVNNTPYYTSDRIAHATGNGLLTFSPRVEGLDELYSDDEIVYFDDNKDLVSKLTYFLSHNNERKDIAKNGRLKAHREYNGTRISNYIVDASFHNDLGDYLWAKI